MKRLEDLPEIAARQLGGLEATPTLLLKAKLAAGEKRAAKRPAWQPVLAGCAALVFVLGAAGAALRGRAPGAAKPETAVTESLLDSRAAGGEGESAASRQAPRLAADVPDGSVTMSAARGASAAALFAKGDGDGFPLIRVNGATYRLLASPDGLDAALLGDALGEVSEFNVEPALGAGDIVSNVAPTGESVCAVKGMKGAMIAARVDGAMRAFQRVSYAGTAIIGSEALEDTLCGADDVQSLLWEGVGEIADADAARELARILLDDSEYAGTSMSGDGSLVIRLKNGLSMQLLVGDDTVSACGTWSCPDFFEAFHEALGE